MPDSESAPTPTPSPDSKPSASHYVLELPLAGDLQQLLPPGQYIIERFLGQGGMGAVYKGFQMPLRRPIAVKIMRRGSDDEFEFEERFRREAYAMAALMHPHIVQVYDCGEAGPNYLFISMELVEGGDLSQLLKAGGMTPEYALQLLVQICDALQAAHDRGIVHRDIKPANIFITGDGRAKVADFGLAKTMDASSFMTQTGMGMGTPDYAAPEQFIGAKDLDHRADIYALGVMMYQMLTGVLPRGAYRPPSQRAAVDPRLDDMVFKAMELNREDRYQSAAELQADLLSLAEPASDPPSNEETMMHSVPLPQVAVAPVQKTETPLPKSGPMKPKAAPPKKPAGAPAKEKGGMGMVIGVLGVVALMAAGAFFMMKKKTGVPSVSQDVATTTASSAAQVVPATPTSSPSVPVVAGQEYWVDALAQWFGATKTNEDFVREKDGGARIGATARSMEPIPRSAAAFRDQAVRMHWRGTHPKADISLYVRHGKNASGKLVSYSAGVKPTKEGGWEVRLTGPAGVLGNGGELPADFKIDASHTIEVRVVGDLITTSMDGKKVAEVRDSTLTAGHPAFSGHDLVIESFEHMNLDAGVSAPSSPAPPSISSPPVVPAARPSSPPPPVVAASDVRDGWQDALALVDLSRDAPKRDWKRDGHSLKPPAGEISMCAIPIVPAPSYDLRLRVRREGSAAGIWVAFTKDEHTGCFVIDCNPAKPNGPRHTGLEMLNGKHVWDTEQVVERPEWLTRGELNEIILQVRDEGFAAFLNGKEIYHWKGNWADLSLPPGWWEDAAPGVPHGKTPTFSLRNWRGMITFEDISWRPVTATELLADAARSDPRLAQLQSGFQTRYEADAQKPFAAAVASLNQSYAANGIARARAAAQSKGSLQEVTALDAEKAAIEKGGGVPVEDAADTPESLKTLRVTYRTAIAKLTAERDAKAAPVYELYAKALDVHIVELTKTNKIEDARKVKALRDRLAAQKAAAASAPASATPNAAARAAGRAPKMNERDLAEWVIATGSNGVEVTFGTPPVTQRITISTELPKGRFILPTLWVNCDKVPGKDLSPLASAQDTTNLWLESSVLTDTASLDLSPLRQMPKLRWLRFSMRNLDAAAVDVVSSLADISFVCAGNMPEGSLEKITKLKQLVTLDSPSITGPDIAVLKSCKQLRDVRNMGNPALSDDDIRLLAATLPDLERLQIGGLAITNACIPALGSFKSLNFLQLNCQGLDDSVMEALSKLPHLTVVTLTGSKIVGSNFDVLKKCASLRELLLDGCPVTDGALDALVPIKGLIKLQLRGTKVTDAGIAKFKAARPDCDVSK